MKFSCKIALCVLSLAVPVSAANADTPEGNALALNTAYEAATKTGLSPQSLGERLTCSALWDRWSFAVDSTADPKFTGSLRRELSSSYAKKRKTYWLREARREKLEFYEESDFEEYRVEAETYADKLYAAYMNNEAKGMKNMMDWLGTCQ